MTVVLSIDPGLNNGVAIVDDERQLRYVGELVATGDGPSRRINVCPLADLLKKHGVTHAIVEDVSSMPKQGTSSTFRFGRAAGTIEGAIGVLGLPMVFVRPSK